MSRAMHHIGLNCADPIAIERWYAKHFGFERKRVYLPGPDQVVVIGNGGVALELFPAEGDAPPPRGEKDGPTFPGVRHLAFLVDDLDAKLAEMKAPFTEEQFQERLKASNQTIDDLKHALRRNLTSEKLWN